MTARDIVRLLASRHLGDVFVAECKDGPTQMTTHNRMDAWAMRKSWANFCTIAYEVKMSRSDFLNDHKWQSYLASCNEFYFVAPKGLIGKNELPPEAGLMEVFATGNGLRIVKKAPSRSTPISSLVFEYVLMCRTRIVDEYDNSREARIERRQKELADAKMVGRTIEQLVSRRHKQIEDENQDLRSRIAKIENIEKLLAGKGFMLSKWAWESGIAADIVSRNGDIRDALRPALEQLVKAIEVVSPLLAQEPKDE